MGQIEKDVARRMRRSKIQSAIIATIAVVGVVSIAAVAPGVARLLPLLDTKGPRRARHFKNSTNRAFWRLVERGYIVLVDTPRGKVARLTPRGEAVMATLNNPGVHLKKPRKWDKKWRVLIFDITEKKRAARDRLRSTLENIGFRQLQRSVWVYPYDCEDLLALVKTDMKAGRGVLYMVVDKIEYDQPLKAAFGLA